MQIQNHQYVASAKPLSILVVEDSEFDYELLIATLQHDGWRIDAQRVDNEVQMIAALSHGHWDAVISDHNMPQFSSFAALDTLKRSGPDIPFIVVSGEAGEEIAVEAVLAGADDYIMKDRMKRLAPALKRAMLAAQTRGEKRDAEADLQLSEARLRELTLHLQTLKEVEWAAIAREVHDDIGGSLTAIKFNLAWLRPRQSEPEAQARLSETTLLVDQAMQSSQQIMLSLRPGILDEGLVSALEWLSRSFSKRCGCEMRNIEMNVC